MTDLDRATEELNDALDAAEQALNRLGLGVSAEVLIDPADGSVGALAFGRKGDMWRLLWISAGEEVPVVNTSRRRRVLAAHRLDALLDALYYAVRERHADVEGATKVALDFAAKVGGAR